MQLTNAEKAMRDGADGPAVAKAMDLLIRYGEALDAPRLVETQNVTGTISLSNPTLRDLARDKGFDAAFSEFNLDSDTVVPTPNAKVYTCQLIQGFDLSSDEMRALVPGDTAIHEQADKFYGKRGVNMMSTCTPYQVGNVPVKGEHCAWMESSAVIYCNGVLGARTNTEGRESSSAASLTGRIPYWGFHTPEHRRGTHHVHIDVPVTDMMDWGLLGYYIGEIVQEDIPVLDGIAVQPNLIRLKHFGAAAASSGGVEMYHIPGVTPEANSIAEAFGGRGNIQHFRYGAAERRLAYDRLNSQASDPDLDFIMLGCPHNSIEQVWTIASMLDGKRLSPNVRLWVFTPKALREIADRNGYTDIIRRAGGQVLSDTCPAISRLMPAGTKVVATDSAKQAHYLPALTGVQTWFGSVEDCVRAGISGKWEGRAP